MSACQEVMNGLQYGKVGFNTRDGDCVASKVDRQFCEGKFLRVKRDAIVDSVG